MTLTGTVGIPMTYTLPQAFDSAQGLPAGLTLNGQLIFGTPLVAGTTVATLVLSGTPQVNLAITIDPSSQSAVGTVGIPFTYALSQNWNSASGLPGGLALSGQTLTGIPSTGGTTTVVLSASDGTLGNLVITIYPSATQITGTAGVPFSYSLPTGWLVADDDGSLPAGLIDEGWVTV